MPRTLNKFECINIVKQTTSVFFSFLKINCNIFVSKLCRIMKILFRRHFQLEIIERPFLMGFNICPLSVIGWFFSELWPSVLTCLFVGILLEFSIHVKQQTKRNKMQIGRADAKVARSFLIRKSNETGLRGAIGRGLSHGIIIIIDR